MGQYANTNKLNPRVLRWLPLILGSICHFAWNLTWKMQLSSFVNENESGSTSVPSQQSKLSPIHVAFGLLGNHIGFLSEFEVALKSVLLNAPLERDLVVHVLADRDAYRGAGDVFDRTELSAWVTRNPIEVNVYNVMPQITSLERQIMDTFNGTMTENFKLDQAMRDHRLTVGSTYQENPEKSVLGDY